MPTGDAPPAKRARASARVVEDSDGWSSESDASDDRPIATVAQEKQEKESARAKKGKVRGSRVDRAIEGEGDGSAAEGVTAYTRRGSGNPNAWTSAWRGCNCYITSHRCPNAPLCMQTASTAELADPGKDTAIPCGSPPKRNAVPARAPPAASKPPPAATPSPAPSSSDNAGSSGVAPERSPPREAGLRGFCGERGLAGGSVQSRF